MRLPVGNLDGSILMSPSKGETPNTGEGFERTRMGAHSWTYDYHPDYLLGGVLRYFVFLDHMHWLVNKY